jgi:hypothetical protein
VENPTKEKMYVKNVVATITAVALKKKEKRSKCI